MQKKPVKKQVKKQVKKKEVRKPNPRKRRIFLIFFLSLLIIAGIVGVLLSPIFTIKSVEIKGMQVTTEESLKDLLAIEDGTNIFIETNGKIKDALKKNPYIDEVRIKRQLPSKLIITVKEREIAYLIEVEGKFAYINSQGYIIDTNREKLDNVIILEGYETSVESIIAGEKLCKLDISKLNDVAQIIKYAKNYDILSIITKINISKSDDYVIHLDGEQKTAHLGDTKKLNEKIQRVKAIVEKEKGHAGEIFVNMDLNTKKPYFREKV